MSLLGKWFGFGRDEVFDEAIRLVERGDYEDAAEAFETCLDHASEPGLIRDCKLKLAETCDVIADRLQASGQHSNALRWRIRACELTPSFADRQFRLALTYAFENRWLEAKAACSQALSRNPDYQAAKLFEQEANNPASSYETLTQLQRLEHSQASSGSDPLRLASEAVSAKDFETAALAYRRAIDTVPNYADVRCRYGQVLLELNEVEQALEQFQVALTINPNYAEALAQSGIALRRLRRDREARDAFAAASRIDPNHPIASIEAQRIAAPIRKA
jgi:tetratricopeptide (TPR) repeat protein